MRDILKSKEHFDILLDKYAGAIKVNIDCINSGNMSQRKIEQANLRNIGLKIDSMTVQYSMGLDFSNIRISLIDIIEDMKRFWSSEGNKVTSKNGIKLNQYLLEPYQKFLKVLSLAYLLNVSDNYLQVLIDILDKDNISDNLFEVIIKARFPDRINTENETYDKTHSIILKNYNNLRKATQSKKKEDSIKLIKEYLKKDFYNKYMLGFKTHLGAAVFYCGYWSFEAATIVKIMGIDDSSFINHKYYPKDLVHNI